MKNVRKILHFHNSIPDLSAVAQNLALPPPPNYVQTYSLRSSAVTLKSGRRVLGLNSGVGLGGWSALSRGARRDSRLKDPARVLRSRPRYPGRRKGPAPGSPRPEEEQVRSPKAAAKSTM